MGLCSSAEDNYTGPVAESFIRRASIDVNAAEVLRRLNEENQPVDCIDRMGQTALGWCCYRGKTDMVKLLVDNGADVNHQDDDGRTPLHWAARKGHLAIVALLLEEGADVNVRSLAKGETPLHKAAAQGHVPVVRRLLQAGADKAVKNCDGLTPLQVTEVAIETESMPPPGADAGKDAGAAAAGGKGVTITTGGGGGGRGADEPQGVEVATEVIVDRYGAADGAPEGGEKTADVHHGGDGDDPDDSVPQVMLNRKATTTPLAMTAQVGSLEATAKDAAESGAGGGGGGGGGGGASGEATPGGGGSKRLLGGPGDKGGRARMLWKRGIKKVAGRREVAAILRDAGQFSEVVAQAVAGTRAAGTGEAGKALNELLENVEQRMEAGEKFGGKSEDAYLGGATYLETANERDGYLKASLRSMREEEESKPKRSGKWRKNSKRR